MISPTKRRLEYLAAYRSLIRRRQRPTLQRLATALNVTRQTVWQMEQAPWFYEWLTTELRLWRQGYGWMNAEGEVQGAPEK